MHRVSIRHALQKVVFLMAALSVVLPATPAGAERVIPDCLRFGQSITVEDLRPDLEKRVTLPETCLPRVDQEIAGIIDQMIEQAEPYLPEERWQFTLKSVLDAGSTITRVGDRYMSFVTVLRITEESNQIYADFQARTFNMETGEQIRLADIVDENAGGFEFLSLTAQIQLASFFPHLETDTDTLIALCSPEALHDTPFALSPGHLTLLWHTWDLYPDAPAGLMRIEIYYPDLKPYMTETALKETDCSGYQLLALTYDDGPVQSTSDHLMDQLRMHGAQATFFVIASYNQKWPLIVRREYDAGHSVQSHNWVHEYTGITVDNVSKWTTHTFSSFEEILGIRPVMMRAPGGSEAAFIKSGSPLPQIHWSFTTTDASRDEGERSSVRGMVMNVSHNTKDGDIVLMHDLYSSTVDAALRIIDALQARGYVFVTVSELAEAKGIDLAAGSVYTKLR